MLFNTCRYCHKVVLQLEEKKIPYIVEKINMRCYGDKPAEFLRKVPSGLLPVLEVEGQVITESAVIQQLLESWFPQPALLPPKGTDEYDRAMELMRLERELFGAWLGWLCNGWDDAGNRATFERTMNRVDAALGATEGPYFLSSFSLVDITFAPFLERIVASIPYYKGMIVRGQVRREIARNQIKFLPCHALMYLFQWRDAQLYALSKTMFLDCAGEMEKY